jgi:hypothetical protein
VDQVPPFAHICIPSAAVSGGYTHVSMVDILQHPMRPAVGHAPPLPFWATHRPLPDALTDAAHSVAQFCCVQLLTAMSALMHSGAIIIVEHRAMHAASLQPHVGMHLSQPPHAPPELL